MIEKFRLWLRDWLGIDDLRKDYDQLDNELGFLQNDVNRLEDEVELKADLNYVDKEIQNVRDSIDEN